ncbi:MAG: queuosine precursor transporter [Fusobacteria bacterium]|nr:queuosine precursor transporter [Fusobacteriota bacterium]
MFGQNEILTVLEIMINFVAIMLIYRYFGKLALVVWVSVALIMANLQVGILISTFGMSATLGNVAYASTYLATDILNENYGPKVARRAVLIAFFILIIFILTMNFCFMFDTSNNMAPFKAVFTPLFRYLVASLIAYFVSENTDILIYGFFKKRNPSFKLIWFRCNLSPIFSELLDTTIFSLIAFWGVFSLPVMISISLSTYLIKVITSMCDTPLVYLAKYWKLKGKIDGIDAEIHSD